MVNEKEVLKPCPFCGGEDLDGRDWDYVECEVCEALVEAWNKRASERKENNMKECNNECEMYPMGPWCIECKHCSEKFQDYTKADIEKIPKNGYPMSMPEMPIFHTPSKRRNI